MAERGPLAQLARSTPAHVAFAFLAMGGWAAFANHAHGPTAMLFAYVLQGAISALLTLFLKRWLEWSWSGPFARLTTWPRKLLPPTISCLAIAALLWTAHRIAGTPAILTTIALPWSVSTAYAFVYTATLAGRAA
jgi:hypothetical protein